MSEQNRHGKREAAPSRLSLRDYWNQHRDWVAGLSRGRKVRYRLFQALVAVCGHAKYRQRLTLAAGEIPALTLKLKPGEDVLEAARDLVEDLKLAAEEAAGGTP